MSDDKQDEPLEGASSLLNESTRLSHGQLLGREAWHETIGVASQEEFVKHLKIFEPPPHLRLENLHDIGTYIYLPNVWKIVPQ